MCYDFQQAFYKYPISSVNSIIFILMISCGASPTAIRCLAHLVSRSVHLFNSPLFLMWYKFHWSDKTISSGYNYIWAHEYPPKKRHAIIIIKLNRYFHWIIIHQESVARDFHIKWYHWPLADDRYVLISFQCREKRA